MKRIISVLLIVVLTFVFIGTALAGGGGGSGITLHRPSNTVDCEPTFHIYTTGVPASFSVRYNLFEATPNGFVLLDSGFVSGNLDFTYTPPSLEPGASHTYVIAVAVFNANNVLKQKLSGKWTTTCQ